MTDSLPSASFAAAIYAAHTPDRAALAKFVAKLRASGTRVGGLLQEALLDDEGEVIGLNAVDVAANRRIPITQPVPNSDGCAFDVSALAETAAVIDDAVTRRADMIVVEKFGELEQNGQGLINEILQAIAAGIPLLIAVPEAALPRWRECSGDMGSILTFDEAAFENWWRCVTEDAQSAPG